MLPQLIYLFFGTLNLGLSIAMHGRPQKDHDAWATVIAMLMGQSLLYWGGFYDCFLNQ